MISAQAIATPRLRGYVGAVERPATTIDPILARQAEFRAFLISRLGSEADSEDVLQNALMKALRSANELRDEEKVIAWFYQVLRNAIVDHVRSQQARKLRDDSWAANAATLQDNELEKLACRCVDTLIDDLNPREAELVRRIELGNEQVAEAAKSAGISPNNASVTLHRARKKLREGLEHFCGECSTGACLNCDCPPHKE